ncbi:uncharacterized protein HaLaN_05124, partial [Haematococcus lacustris]
AQLSKARNETACMKEQLKDAEAAAADKDAQIHRLTATIQSLQLAGSQAADTELAGLRVKVAQLETTLKAKDVQLEKLRWVLPGLTLAAAAALTRAFAAEDALARLEAELPSVKARHAALEQSSRARERELLGGLADADAKLATQASSLTLLQERLSSAQEGWRKAESESAQLQSRLLTSEQALKASGREVAKLKEEVEAVRSATYLEDYRAEDELRAVKEELGARAARVAHLEHVLKAKDRDVARVKEEREASKAVERERAKVAEEVTIRIETELQACKQKAAQLESSLRTSQREARQLEEALRAARGAEGDVLIKSSKAEDGARRLESEVTNTKLRALQVEAQLKARERDVQQLSRTIEGVRSELYESDARAVRAEELVRYLEKEAAVARSRCLNSEGAVRVKERELERMARLLEAAKLADVTSSSRVSAAEDSSRRLEGELASARVKIAQLESGIKSREQQIDKLSKTLDGLRREEFDVVLQVGIRGRGTGRGAMN